MRQSRGEVVAKPKTKDEAQKVLEHIRSIGPFLQASLTHTRKRCGNPKCRCASEGPIHPSTLLTWKEKNKTHTLYVPQALVHEVMQWVKEYKKLKRLMDQMSAEQKKRLKSMKSKSKR